MLIAELAAAAKAEGKTIFDTLDELYLVHGLHASDQLSIRVADLACWDAMMNRLRVSPPDSFGGSAVETAADLAAGQRTAAAHRRTALSDQGQHPRHHPPQRHRTEAQVLPRGDPQRGIRRRTAAGAARGRAALDSVLADVREALGL